jgi:hypothetical protein
MAASRVVFPLLPCVAAHVRDTCQRSIFWYLRTASGAKITSITNDQRSAAGTGC